MMIKQNNRESKSKSLLFEQINILDKPLVKLKKRREKLKLPLL